MALYVPIGCVRLTRYCGKMYSHHLFSVQWIHVTDKNRMCTSSDFKAIHLSKESVLPVACLVIERFSVECRK